MKQRGFTLTEVLITIAVVGILAAISIPSYINHIEKAHYAEVVQAATAAKTSVLSCYSTLATFSGCSNNRQGIPAAVRNGTGAVRTMTITNGRIRVVPNAKNSITRRDVYILTPRASNSGAIRWIVSGRGATKYAYTGS